jgi:hypothetical protein
MSNVDTDYEKHWGGFEGRIGSLKAKLKSTKSREEYDAVILDAMQRAQSREELTEVVKLNSGHLALGANDDTYHYAYGVDVDAINNEQIQNDLLTSAKRTLFGNGSSNSDSSGDGD